MEEEQSEFESELHVLDYNAMVKENELLRTPDVSKVRPASVFIDPETNEIHIENLIIRLPVDYSTPADGIQKTETGHDAPERLKSLPFNLENTLKLINSFSTIDESNAKNFILNELSGILNLKDYDKNLYSFWVLDTFGTILWEAQKKKMSAENQVTLLNWFLYFIDSVMYTDLPRKEFFAIIRQLFVKTGEWMSINMTSSVPKQGVEIQTPINLKIQNEEGEKLKSGQSEQIFYDNSITTDPCQDLKLIADQLYDVFSGRLEFEMIREVFWNEPLIQNVQLSEKILIPKPLKPKPDDKSKFDNVKSSIRKGSVKKGGRRLSSKKSISRKSVSRKSVSRKSGSRKSVSRKSVSRKSVSRKSISRKKSVGGGRQKGSAKPERRDTPAAARKEAILTQTKEAMARAAAEKAKREEETCIQFLTDAVDMEKFMKDLFADVDFQKLPDKWKKNFAAPKGEGRKTPRRKSARRQSSRKSLRRQSKK